MREGLGFDRVAAPEPLLAPTEALLRGFDFDAPAPTHDAVSPRPADDANSAILLREGFRIGELRLMTIAQRNRCSWFSATATTKRAW